MRPILVYPVLGPEGQLLWVVKSADEQAVLDANTGAWKRACPLPHPPANLEPHEAFEAVVGALSEWTEADRDEWYGLNAMKVRAELESKKDSQP